MGKSLSDYDWNEIREALEAYAAHVEATEPAAVNTIATFRAAADECPTEDELAGV